MSSVNEILGTIKFECKDSLYKGIHNLVRNEIYFDSDPEELTVSVIPCEELFVLNHRKETEFYNSIRKLMDLNLYFDANPRQLEITLTGGL